MASDSLAQHSQLTPRLLAVARMAAHITYLSEAGLTEKFGRKFPELVNEVKLNHRQPLFVEIPDRHGTGRKPDFITAYVNEAIGLKL